MMINKNSDSRTTEDSFRTSLKRRAVIMSLYIVFGIAMIIWLYLGYGGSVPDGHARGFFSGFSSAITVAGAVMLIRYIRCMNNPERFQKAYTEYADERNRFVLMKSYFYSAYIFILLMALATIVVYFLGMPLIIGRTLAACICVFALIIAITYRVMNRIH